MKHKMGLALALVLPLVFLGTKALWHIIQGQQGTEVKLAIIGFDPRDLLSGHYLTYQVDYELPDLCAANHAPKQICLLPRSETADISCEIILKGECNKGVFKAGIERFFIPEQYASALDQAIRNKQGELVITVNHEKAQVKELLIDGQPWLDFIKHQP